MVFCLKIFNEIGIFDYSFINNIFKLTENKNIHSSLDNSKTYTSVVAMQKQNVIKLK